MLPENHQEIYEVSQVNCCMVLQSSTIDYELRQLDATKQMY